MTKQEIADIYQTQAEEIAKKRKLTGVEYINFVANYVNDLMDKECDS